jgi:hypothetical protein
VYAGCSEGSAFGRLLGAGDGGQGAPRPRSIEERWKYSTFEDANFGLIVISFTAGKNRLETPVTVRCLLKAGRDFFIEVQAR